MTQKEKIFKFETAGAEDAVNTLSIYKVPLKRNQVMHSKTVVGTNVQKMGMTGWRNSEAVTVDLN